jgi:hypothetical protein
VRLAARGARNLDGGDEPVTDPEQARRLRAQARRIHAESLVAAGLATGVSLLVSVWIAGRPGAP